MERKKAGRIALGVLCAGGAGCILFHRCFRVPLREYTRCALYMATLDDEICRQEWNRLGQVSAAAAFPEKAESLQYRYHMDLGMNQGKSRRQLQQEIADMEQRLWEFTGENTPGR